MSAPAPALPALAAAAVTAAADAVSKGGTFRYTRRNLFYELVRGRALELPARAEPAPVLAAFGESLGAHERTHGRLPGLIRPEELPAALDRGALDPDVLDYSVRRLLVFDRLEPMLLFALNEFHLRLEIGLCSVPAFPPHVWERVRAQLRDGFPTLFCLLHDCDKDGYYLKRRLEASLAEQGSIRTFDVGMSFDHAFKLGATVRSIGRRRRVEPQGEMGPEEALMLTEGAYAHLEEARPHDLLQWTYRRLAKGYDESGFG